MKKLITIIAIALVAALSVMVFAGCANSSFLKLSRAINASAETADSLDAVDEGDLDEMGDAELYAGDVMMLSVEAAAEEEGQATKVAHALSLYQDIRSKGENIETLKTDLKTAVAAIKELISEFKAANLELTAEERDTIDAYTDEILTINETLSGTIGKAYKRMHDLKGSYNLAHIDEIETTFTEVDEVLQVRVDGFTRLQEIAADLNAMLTARING